MDARKFSAFPKISEAAAKLKKEEADQLFAAWWRYGAFGEKTEFDNVYLSAIYSLMLEDIDNSVKASNGNSGGRPKKQAEPKQGSDYALQCLKVFNETSIAYGKPEATANMLSHDNWQYLNTQAEIPIDQVKAMCNAKFREWNNNKAMARSLKPNILFSPKHFIAYIDEAKGQVINDDGYIKQAG